MKSLTVEDPGNLFPQRRDAVSYLVGLGGFWGGAAGGFVAADLGAPSSVVVVFFMVAIGSWLPLVYALRKLEHNMTGRSVRPWPFGYLSLRTQILAILPSTVMAAALRLRLNAVIVTVAIYAVLVIGFIALVLVTRPITR